MDAHVPEKIAEGICYHPTPVRRTPNGNVAEAIHVASQCEAKWVLFLEDDIEVCGEFLDSVGLWLDRNERNNRHVYVFGSVWSNGQEEYTEVLTSNFFGTQAFAIRIEHGNSLAEFLVDNEFSQSDKGDAYDLILTKWAVTTWPHISHFGVSNPSFVQHIGMNSVINPRNDIHTFPSWPGKNWSYVSRVC